jgi:protein-tyrosine phosphatase
MPGFADIHAHVLPGIDDGPDSMDGSLRLLRAAADCGIGTIASTPHIRPDFPNVHLDELAERCRQVWGEAEQAGIGVELVSGAEVSLGWALDAGQEELTLASYGQRGGDLLIETPLVDVASLERSLYDVRVRGFRVILAHPERSEELQKHPQRLADLAEDGVLLQVNAESLLGARARSGIGGLAAHLCAQGIAHAIASDGHRAQSWRPVTLLTEGVEAVAALVGRERAQWMAADAPGAILAGQPLPEPPPVTVVPRRRRWFRRG